MVDVIAYLNDLDPVIIVPAVLVVFMLQTPILAFPVYTIMMYISIREGFLWGVVISATGSILSSIVGYLLGRLSSVNSPRNRYIRRFQRFTERYGLRSVIILRIAPVIPFNVTSIASGFTRLEWKRYLALSSISSLPWIFIWCFIGDRYLSLIIGDIHLDVTGFHLFIATLLIAALAALKIYQIRTQKV